VVSEWDRRIDGYSRGIHIHIHTQMGEKVQGGVLESSGCGGGGGRR